MICLRSVASADGRRGHVVDYHHLIGSLRRKPMALLNLVYRDQLFPRDAYRRTFDALLEALDEREACRRMVGLLALAHDRCCEAALAARLAELLETGTLPELESLEALFAPDPQSLPRLNVRVGSPSDYNDLLTPPLTPPTSLSSGRALTRMYTPSGRPGLRMNRSSSSTDSRRRMARSSGRSSEGMGVTRSG